VPLWKTYLWPVPDKSRTVQQNLDEVMSIMWNGTKSELFSTLQSFNLLVAISSASNEA
jgi:hypothetical protein